MVKFDMEEFEQPRRSRYVIRPFWLTLLPVLGVAWMMFFEEFPQPQPAAVSPQTRISQTESTTAEPVETASAHNEVTRQPAADESPTPLRNEPETAVRESNPWLVRDVTIRDLSGGVAYRGDVDLAPTLARIERGERHPHRNDGGVFRNLERRLPKQPEGHYREYVHPTPNLSGPGPQRLVIGRTGEIYYTHDHYKTFRLLRGPQ